jgi:very-short-patch-repair endonuclease
MNDTHNRALVPNSKELRKNMTKEQKHLWYDFLKKLPINVNRQKVIGRYIVDFYISEAKIVIELDGWQHYEEDAKSKDEERDDCLTKMGILVLRYTNKEINSKFNGVCADIQSNIDKRIK